MILVLTYIFDVCIMYDPYELHDAGHGKNPRKT